MTDKTFSIKEISKLDSKSVRDQEGVFLVEGKKVLAEVYLAGLPVIQVLTTEKFLREQHEFLQLYKINRHDVTIISDQNALRITGTKTPQGVFAVVKKPETQLFDLLKYNFLVVLENIRDPGNLGTILRTADWFGVKGVIVSEDGADPYNDKVVRSAMGSLFHLDVYSSYSLVDDLQELKDAGFKLIATRPEAPTTLQAADLSKFALVMGNESLGTSAEVDGLADVTYSIPKYGNAESLNVAVSFGIVTQKIIELLPQAPLKSIE
jgi:TrmH family RNA methyltransferase